MEEHLVHTTPDGLPLGTALDQFRGEGPCLPGPLQVAQGSVPFGMISPELVQPVRMAREIVGVGCSGEQCS